MKKFDLTKKILDSGALAVVRATPERALQIARGIIKGGIPVMEISYTNFDATEAIEQVCAELGDQILVGAGTVNNGETAKEAIKAGAGFLYSPMFDARVMEMANEYQIPYAPGCATVTEAMVALRAGATFIKFFPYGGLMGPESLKTIKTPLPDMPLLESGGVNAGNVQAWLAAGAEVLGIGGALSKGESEEIADSALAIRREIDLYREKMQKNVSK